MNGLMRMTFKGKRHRWVVQARPDAVTLCLSTLSTGILNWPTRILNGLDVVPGNVANYGNDKAIKADSNWVSMDRVLLFEH